MKQTLNILVNDPNITLEQLKEFINKLPSGIQSFNPNEDVAAIWSILDVQYQAKERDLELTDIEAKDILDDMYHNHDATIGINWDVIDCYLDLFEQEKENAQVNG
jgi:hypothetical protein